VLLGLALLIGRFAVVLLFAFCSYAALREFLTLTTKTQSDHKSLVVAFYVVLPLQYLFVYMGWPTLVGSFIPVYAFLLLPMISVFRGDTNRFLIRVAETQWALMISIYCASHIPALMALDIPDYGDRAILLIAFLVIVVQLADLVEYFFGRQFGKHRIAPGISPKTWEGLAAGMVGAAVVGASIAWITPFGMMGAGLMGMAIFGVGLFGSLVLAAIKRDRGVRDWSHLIPGQGGFIDQLDSVLFAAPLFFQLTRFFYGA